MGHPTLAARPNRRADLRHYGWLREAQGAKLISDPLTVVHPAAPGPSLQPQ